MIDTPLLCFVSAALAVARLTRLVTSDYVTERPRRWVQLHAPDALVYFTSCPWCVSIWFGGLVAPIVVLWNTNRVVEVVLLALAFSQVAGLLSRLDEPEPVTDAELGE